MTEEKFTELVNLYLDKEISAEDFKLLEAEIAARSDKKRAFEDRCRLHKAMRLALKPEIERTSRSRSRSRRSSSSSRRSRSRPVTRISEVDESVYAPGSGGLPRWLLVPGMAAAVAVGFVLLQPVFQNTTDAGAQAELVGVTERDLEANDPLSNLGRSELRRYVAAQQPREAKNHSSLIAQMRLMGLRPEFTPVDKQLKEVDLAAVYMPKKQVNQAELFQRIQGLRAMPEAKLLRVEEAGSSSPTWTNAFESSQVNFGDDSSAIRF